MTQPAHEIRSALVLPGGGARGAFQVGVLKAVAELLPRNSSNPFRVISGTSAGAVNSVVLASRAQHLRSAVAELEQVWGHFRCHHVYKTDHLTMLKSSLHWLISIVLGGWRSLSSYPGCNRRRLPGRGRRYGGGLCIGPLDVFLRGLRRTAQLGANAPSRQARRPESRSHHGEHRRADGFSASQDR
jgi:hypothetical protein